MRILFVSPTDTPPKGWGAVQKIIWERKLWLEAHGHEAVIYCLKPGQHVYGTLTAPWTFDLVHVETDTKILQWKQLQDWYGFPMLVSTHYGYAPFPEKWNPDHFGIPLAGLRKSEHILVQSPQIVQALQSNGVRGRIHQLPNGIQCGDILFSPVPEVDTGVICLGRVEARKRQADLAQMMSRSDIPVDFVGPLHPTLDSFEPELLGNNLHYRGAWTRQEVAQRLTSYRAYVLISDGETQVPLATMEAMAAGLSVVTTANAAHLLPEELPFVYRIDPDADDVAAVVRRAVEENAGHREAIRRYALEHFDWDVIAPQYLDIAQEVAANSTGLARFYRRLRGRP